MWDVRSKHTEMNPVDTAGAPRLEIYQSLWAMQSICGESPLPEAPRHFARIAEARYAGVCLDLDVSEIEQYRMLRPLFERYQLKCLINAFVRDTQELARFIELARELDAPFLNVVGCLYPKKVDEAAVIVESWLEEALRRVMPITIETHRDSITNDMFFTLQLLEALPHMRLCVDLSHYVVGRELRLPLDIHWRALFGELLERAECFHGRIASRQQVQVTYGFPQHREWLDQFKFWWAEGMCRWRSRAASGAALPFVCELGPSPYAITDATGRELSDRWLEAQQLRDCAVEIWHGLRDVPGVVPG